MEATTRCLKRPGYLEHQNKFGGPYRSKLGCHGLEIARSATNHHISKGMSRTININASNGTRHILRLSISQISDLVKWDGPRRWAIQWDHHISEVSSKPVKRGWGYGSLYTSWVTLTQMDQHHPSSIYRPIRDHRYDLAQCRRLRL